MSNEYASSHLDAEALADALDDCRERNEERQERIIEVAALVDETRDAVRQVTRAVLEDWRLNNGNLRADTIHKVYALARIAKCADLF